MLICLVFFSLLSNIVFYVAFSFTLAEQFGTSVSFQEMPHQSPSRLQLFLGSVCMSKHLSSEWATKNAKPRMSCFSICPCWTILIWNQEETKTGNILRGHPQHDFLSLKNWGFICILCIDKVQKGLTSELGVQRIGFWGNWWPSCKSWKNIHVQRIFGLSTETPNRSVN